MDHKDPIDGVSNAVTWFDGGLVEISKQTDDFGSGIGRINVERPAKVVLLMVDFVGKHPQRQSFLELELDKCFRHIVYNIHPNMGRWVLRLSHPFLFKRIP